MKDVRAGCDWLIRASLIRKKGCWEIRRYNGRHTCTIETISQDYSKLDSDTVAEAIKPLVETDPSIKVKSIIAEVQSRFNYTISYRKAWAFRHCKPLVQVDGTHLYRKYKGTLLVAVAQDGNQNIVPIAFALVEGETADVWHFFLRNLRMYIVRKDGVGMISDWHESIRAVVNHFGGDWQPPRTWWMFCIRHIRSNFLRAFKVPHLQKLVVNIGYPRTVEEYNINYKRLEEQGEAYAKWCDHRIPRLWRIQFTHQQIPVRLLQQRCRPATRPPRGAAATLELCETLHRVTGVKVPRPRRVGSAFPVATSAHP
ncbi:uncharacterized protein [Arachis hypogaea]|uniref:uncharacterized protein n=1 Tax=Arachis hypogaea TaxID=3818 RepID=UPI003B20CEF6